MTLPKSIIISSKDTKKVTEFKKRIAERDCLKIIDKKGEEKEVAG